MRKAHNCKDKWTTYHGFVLLSGGLGGGDLHKANYSYLGEGLALGTFPKDERNLVVAEEEQRGPLAAAAPTATRMASGMRR